MLPAANHCVSSRDRGDSGDTILPDFRVAAAYTGDEHMRIRRLYALARRWRIWADTEGGKHFDAPRELDDKQRVRSVQESRR